eukprot:COSAG06_NODE_31643_length_518_cov_0.735084_1_plen_26_part_10
MQMLLDLVGTIGASPTLAAARFATVD